MVQLEKGKYSRLIKVTWVFFSAALALFLFYAYAVSINFLGLFGALPDLKFLENPKNDLASELYSADGVLMGKYFTSNRSPVEYEQISPNVINALLATEDARFEKHSGIDFKGTFAIVWSVLTLDPRGSSTITQQLAKNLFNTRGKDYRGSLGGIPGLNMLIIKTKEWIMAIKLEKNYTKKEIIKMYLNTVPFGSNAYGISTAAKTFFGKKASDLTTEEAALLVGIVKGTSYYSPVYHPNRALERRNVVLSQMVKYGYLSSDKYSELKTKPIDMAKYAVENNNKGSAPYFREVIRGFLYKWAKARSIDLDTEGLRIYTTIDSKMQKYAEEAVTENMKDQQKKFFAHWKGRNPWITEDYKEIPGYIEKEAKKTGRFKQLKKQYSDNEAAIWKEMNKPVKMKVFSWNGEKDTTLSPMDSIRYYKHFLHTGFMSMDPNTGHVKAWVGGIDFKHFKYDHVMQGKRQPGSSFKPIVYATAIDNGYHPCQEVLDAPVTFASDIGGEPWTPNNSDGPPSYERMTLRRAMGRSINTISAKLMQEFGPNRVVDYAKRLGIRSPLEPVPSLCLGTSPVSVYELLGAYSTFVNGGIWTKPMFITRIENRYGEVIESFPPTTVEALSEETAYLMVHMLQGALQEEGGTAQGLFRYKMARTNEIGGKTGTTQNYSDGWFVGVTQDLVTGVWVGGDDMSIHFRSMSLGQGGRMALPAWGSYMDKVASDPNLGLKNSKFRRPKNLPVSLNCEDYNTVTPSDSTQQQYVAPSTVSTDEGIL
jgi:penicillin-binding protein 1A